VIQILNNDRANVHAIAAGEKHLDFGEIVRIEQALLGIPLHSLPAKLVTDTMIVSATVRQFRAKVQDALRYHREMDADAFADLFKTTAEMRESLKQSCDDIEAKLRAVEASA
jgi:hypothetical protein